VSTRFGGGLGTFVGHRIHLMYTCQLLICQASLLWIGDIRNPWHFAWQPLIGWDKEAWIDEVEG
jgi:hypothetical protein